LFFRSVFIQANPFVKVKEIKWNYSIHNCSVEITYPKLKRLNKKEISKQVIKELNYKLKKIFLSYNDTCKDAKKESPANGMRIFYDVGLNDENFISITYDSSSYNAEYNGPYPDNVYNAFTIDIRNGKILQYGDVFLSGKKTSQVLYKKISESLTEMGVPFTEEEIKKDKYEFYFTKDNLMIFNLFHAHAMQSVQVKIPFKEISKILNPNNIPKE
jgi:hypothetical protein